MRYILPKNCFLIDFYLYYPSTFKIHIYLLKLLLYLFLVFIMHSVKSDTPHLFVAVDFTENSQKIRPDNVLF
jgi:hypothetical protein